MELGKSTLLLDTSAYSAFNRGDLRLRSWFNVKHTILVPLIVIGELRAGFIAGTKTAENEQLLQQFLDSPNVQTIALTDETTKYFAKLFLEIRKTGRAIGTNDLWIAALSLEHNTQILTLDEDFQRVPGLRVIKLSK